MRNLSGLTRFSQITSRRYNSFFATHNFFLQGCHFSSAATDEETSVGDQEEQSAFARTDISESPGVGGENGDGSGGSLAESFARNPDSVVSQILDHQTQGGILEQQPSALDELNVVPPKHEGPIEIQKSPLTEDDEDPDDLFENAFILTPRNHEGTVIWLHGMGKSAEKERSLFEMIAPGNIKFVVPNADLIPITALHEAEERAWFDMEETTISEEMEEDEEGIKDSARRIANLLREEANEVEAQHVILAGYGMGGAMALHVGLNYPEKLAGISCFSAYLALPHYYPEWITPQALNTPILTVHGGSDRAIPADFAKQRYQILQDAGVKQYQHREEFFMGHFMSTESLLGIQQWWVQAIHQSHL